MNKPEMFAIMNLKGEFLDPSKDFIWQQHCSPQTAKHFCLNKALSIMRLMNRADIFLLRIPRKN